MEERIRQRYHEAILEDARTRYGIAADRIRPIDAFENFIFEYQRGSRAYILRLSHSLRRSEALIRGEIDWVNFLGERGAPVAAAIRSEAGNLVEAIDDGAGGHFFATAFPKAEGQKPWHAGWTTGMYETCGRLFGKLHALTKDYEPANPAWRRPAWDDDLFEFVERYLPPGEIIARQKYRAVRDYVRSLPQDRDSYGLIHQDANGANMFVDASGVITLFDFDECAYSWFANDIAIMLFYLAIDEEEPAAYTRQFMTHFLRGYRQENQLAGAWMAEIPHFLKLREIEMYAVIHRDFDLADIDDPWCAAFMQGRKGRIDNDLPTIDFDFETLALPPLLT